MSAAASGGSAFFGSALAQDVDQMREGTSALKDAAGEGHFRISENAAEGLRQALISMQGRLNGLSRDTYLLNQVPDLGSHDYGQLVAEHTHRTASGEPDSALTVVGRLREVLEEAEEAVTLAVRKHQEQDEAAADALPGREL